MQVQDCRTPSAVPYGRIPPWALRESAHKSWDEELKKKKKKKMRDPRRCRLDADSFCYPITVSATLSKYSFHIVTALLKRNS